METETEKDVVVINVSDVTDIGQLHRLLMKSLVFPDYYGMNWDAFWDAITGLVELPDSIVFEGWVHLENLVSEDTKIMKSMFTKLNEIYPTLRCEVKYS